MFEIGLRYHGIIFKYTSRASVLLRNNYGVGSKCILTSDANYPSESISLSRHNGKYLQDISQTKMTWDISVPFHKSVFALMCEIRPWMLQFSKE